MIVVVVDHCCGGEPARKCPLQVKLGFVAQHVKDQLLRIRHIFFFVARWAEKDFIIIGLNRYKKKRGGERDK